MIITIDASNLRRGGGVTHLKEVLSAVNLESMGIERIYLWAPAATLEKLAHLKSQNLHFRSHPLINRGGLFTYLFRSLFFDNLIDRDSDILWVPGGTYRGKFHPYVTMVRNFLPFVSVERDRYKYSKNWFRLLLLGKLQKDTLRNADGIIYISKEAKKVVNNRLDLMEKRSSVIYHGLSDRFIMPPRVQRKFEDFSQENPVRILYVSHINHYKHQDKLIQAVDSIRKCGIPATVNLVGPGYPPALKKFNKWADKLDPNREWIFWSGEVPYETVQTFYHQADLYVYLSSCETFGNILLEAMASGLPIVCSNRSALPEVHAGACVEVDPENVNEIREAIEKTIRSTQLRTEVAEKCFNRAQDFSWETCAIQTFQFLEKFKK